MNTIYKCIASDFEQEIKKGSYKPGQKLPSVRSTAKMYGCSLSTVIKAYDTLVQNHIAYTKVKSGYYVIENLYQINEPSTLINFRTGNVLLKDMNIIDFKHCLNRAADIYGNYSLANNISGLGSLKKLLVPYLASFQVFTSPENIFINLGVQQSLSILSSMPLNEGKNKILIEHPTYSFFIKFLKHIQADVITIERDEKGIDLKQLESLFKLEKIKFFYTVPRNHNPLGTSYTKKQRKKIAALAEKYNVYIIEDDYYADVNPAPGYDPIYAYSNHKHVIYLRSFSKTIPWMRLGIAVIPGHLKELIEHHIGISYYYSYFAASLISQATLEIYLRSKILEKHSLFLTQELKEKQRIIKKYLKLFDTNHIKPIYGFSGLYAYFQVSALIYEPFLIDDLKKSGVILDSGKRFFWDNDSYLQGFRVSLASVSAEQLEDGMHILKMCLDKYKK